MNCSCGNELIEGSNFCDKCGKEVPVYKFFDKETNQKFNSNISPEIINNSAAEIKPGFDFERWLCEHVEDRDTRKFLLAAKDKVVWIGDKAIQIGKFLFSILMKFQNALKGVISAAVVGIIFSLIPFLGVILGPLAFAVLGTLWGVTGLAKDAVQALAPDVRTKIETTMKSAIDDVFVTATNKIASIVDSI
jgi:hypothetical protein